MPQPATTALLQAATSTFESLALLCPEPCAPDGVAFIPIAAAVSVGFRGAREGHVVVGVTAGVLPALAENMLGADAAPDVRLQRDALGELANVVTGNVLPLVHGGAAVFHLDAPTLASETTFARTDGRMHCAIVRLRMEEGEAIIALFDGRAADPTLVGERTAGVGT
jgi:CheY-specific phosphatase CheX